ncbi:hypothetical protein Fmac_014316 [Flemingia macrophylla]|uniref:Uncharacterized protein n=1 Tax=Flemingia macrophylla TaxID=520843 RepID=A0ABD1MBD0_9FABA
MFNKVVWLYTSTQIRAAELNLAADHCSNQAVKEPLLPRLYELLVECMLYVDSVLDMPASYYR